MSHVQFNWAALEVPSNLKNISILYRSFILIFLNFIFDNMYIQKFLYILTFALGSALTIHVKSALPRSPEYTARSAAETSGGSEK